MPAFCLVPFRCEDAAQVRYIENRAEVPAQFRVSKPPTPKSHTLNRVDVIVWAADESHSRLTALRDYLCTAAATDEITTETHEKAWTAWLSLNNQVPSLPVPNASVGPNGELLYSWNKDEHHLELEFVPSEPVEWFYRNRNTQELWDADFTVGVPLSQEVVEKLQLFS